MNPPEDLEKPARQAQYPQDPYNDPAASMSLLNQLLNNPLDAGYLEDHPEPRSRSARLAYKLIVVALAITLGIAFTIAVRALNVTKDINVRSELLQRAQSLQEIVTTLDNDVSQLTTAVKNLSDDVIPQTSVSSTTAISLATVKVTGPGVEVLLNDAPDSALTVGGVKGKVRDQDLRIVVNALWGSGAEAITVNDLRIAPGTFIRTAGSSILVNITAIVPPYSIKAIGDTNALSTSLVRGFTGDYISGAESVLGISVTTSNSESLTMEAMDLRQINVAMPLSTGGQQ